MWTWRCPKLRYTIYDCKLDTSHIGFTYRYTYMYTYLNIQKSSVSSESECLDETLSFGHIYSSTVMSKVVTDENPWLDTRRKLELWKCLWVFQRRLRFQISFYSPWKIFFGSPNYSKQAVSNNLHPFYLIHIHVRLANKGTLCVLLDVQQHYRALVKVPI